MADADAHTVQQLADDVLGIAEKLGFVCPPAALAAAALQGLLDLGFAAYFHSASKALKVQRAAQTAGVAAAAASAATTAIEHRRTVTLRICAPCAEAFAALLAESEAK